MGQVMTITAITQKMRIIIMHTQYIVGSHTEHASSCIKDLAKGGITVKATDIGWDEIGSDALIAEDVIKNPISGVMYITRL